MKSIPRKQNWGNQKKQATKKIYQNKIKKTIIIVNNAIASVKAKPIIAQLNNNFERLGLIEILFNNPLKITPIPTPTPAKAIVPKPAPKNLNSEIIFFLKNIYFNLFQRNAPHSY